MYSGALVESMLNTIGLPETPPVAVGVEVPPTAAGVGGVDVNATVCGAGLTVSPPGSVPSLSPKSPSAKYLAVTVCEPTDKSVTDSETASDMAPTPPPIGTGSPTLVPSTTN